MSPVIGGSCGGNDFCWRNDLNTSSQQRIDRSADGGRRRVGTIITPQSSIEVPVAFAPVLIQCLSAELIQGSCKCDVRHAKRES